MKVVKVTLPLMATLFLAGNSVAWAASPLDPYGYIPAPTSADRAAQQNKGKKKIKKLVVKAKAAPELPVQQAKAPTKPASVIISQSSPKFEEEKEVKATPKTASAPPADSDEGGFFAGIKQSTGGIAKSTKAAGSGVVNGSKAVGSKIAAGFMHAGGAVKDGTAAVGGKIAVVPKKVGEGFKSTGDKVKDGGSSVGEKVASGLGSLAVIPKAVGGAAGKVGRLNPFHHEQTSVALKPKAAPAAAPANAKPDLQEEKKLAKSDNPASEATETAAEIANEPGADAAADQTANTTSEKAPVVAAKPAVSKEKKEKAKTQIAEKKGSSLTGKLAAAPKAGLDVTKAGFDKTKAGVGASVGVLSHGMSKLNPFHKGYKPGDLALPATAKKEPAAPKNVDDAVAPAKAPEEIPAPQLGERIVPDNEVTPEQQPTEHQRIAEPPPAEDAEKPM